MQTMRSWRTRMPIIITILQEISNSRHETSEAPKTSTSNSNFINSKSKSHHLTTMTRKMFSRLHLCTKQRLRGCHPTAFTIRTSSLKSNKTITCMKCFTVPLTSKNLSWLQKKKPNSSTRVCLDFPLLAAKRWQRILCKPTVKLWWMIKNFLRTTLTAHSSTFCRSAWQAWFLLHSWLFWGPKYSIISVDLVAPIFSGLPLGLRAWVQPCWVSNSTIFWIKSLKSISASLRMTRWRNIELFSRAICGINLLHNKGTGKLSHHRVLGNLSRHRVCILIASEDEFLSWRNLSTKLERAIEILAGSDIQMTYCAMQKQ